MRWLLAIFLCASLPAAPTFVNKTSGDGSVVPITSTGGSYTASSNSNVLLLLHSGDFAYAAPSSVTWNGISFTQLDFWAYSPGNYFGGSLWYAVVGNPGGATANVVINYGGAEDATAWGMLEIKDVNQASPIGSYGHLTITAASTLDLPLTTANANSLVAASTSYYFAVDVTSTTGTFTNQVNDNANYRTNISMDTAPAATAGSYPMTYGYSAGNVFGGGFMVELKAAPSATVASQPLSPYHSNDLSPRMAPITRP